MSAPTATTNRQKEVASLALSSERVYQAMLSRIQGHPKGAHTITVALDEFSTIGVHMAQLCGVAKEFHGLLAGGAPSRDEIIMLSGQITMAANGIAAAAQMMQGLIERATAEPVEEGESL